MATKIHAANIDIRSRLPQLHTYNIHQLAAMSLQIERIGEYYRKKKTMNLKTVLMPCSL